MNHFLIDGSTEVLYQSYVYIIQIIFCYFIIRCPYKCPNVPKSVRVLFAPLITTSTTLVRKIKPFYNFV